MSHYRKRPVVIEARLLTRGNVLDVAEWCGGDTGAQPDSGIEINTLEGTHLARFGDYVIQGVKGEFYPCKPDIFDATYEPVEMLKA